MPSIRNSDRARFTAPFRRFNARPFLASLALLLAGACEAPFAAATCGADESAAPRPAGAPRTLSVTGGGTATGVADVANVQLGVQSRDADAGAALTENHEKMSRIVATLRALGVAAADIQTANFSASGQQESDPATGQIREGTLYVVDNTISVTVRSPVVLGELLNQVVPAGATTIYGVSFTVGEQKALGRIASELAVADARARAEQIARASGVTLGRPISISETPAGYDNGTFATFTSASPAAAPLLFGGNSAVSVQATVVYELL